MVEISEREIVITVFLEVQTKDLSPFGDDSCVVVEAIVPHHPDEVESGEDMRPRVRGLS